MVEMFNLKTLSIRQEATPEEMHYLPKESSTAKDKIIYPKGTASYATHRWDLQTKTVLGYHPIHSDHQPNLGVHNQPGTQIGAYFSGNILQSYHDVPGIFFWGVIGSQIYGLESVKTFSAERPVPKPIQSDEIVIIPLRELSRDDAKREITEYIQRAAGRKVYISELAEELCLDIELIMEIMGELETETQDRR